MVFLQHPVSQLSQVSLVYDSAVEILIIGYFLQKRDEVTVDEAIVLSFLYPTVVMFNETPHVVFFRPEKLTRTHQGPNMLI